ncbi:MAG TPA: GNAT family N-acetyltransferase [Anaerolineales bacterium]|nr:GNAT family N-acetyltransferase [Anaerolineales bacterium]
MSKIHIRRFLPADLPNLLNIDHGYTTEYVWQMDVQEGAREISLSFREVKLPRVVRQAYPRDHRNLVEDWLERWGILVAIYGEDADKPPGGYATIAHATEPRIAQITDLAVAVPQRRKGLASALLLSAEDWAAEKGSTRLILEMQSKNVPAIRLAQKLGYDFCGFNDRHYPNKDIALFFGKDLD